MGIPQQTPPVQAEEVIRVGLYSRYFHLNSEQRQRALAYEKALGAVPYCPCLFSLAARKHRDPSPTEMGGHLVELGIGVVVSGTSLGEHENLALRL
jgi:hypothetical protein